jgi:hypothetical protein
MRRLRVMALTAVWLGGACGAPEPRLLDAGSFTFRVRGTATPALREAGERGLKLSGLLYQRRYHALRDSVPLYRIYRGDSTETRSFVIVSRERLRPGVRRIVRGDSAESPAGVWARLRWDRAGGTYWSDSGSVSAYEAHGRVAAAVQMWLSRRDSVSETVSMKGELIWDRSVHELPSLSELYQSHD